MDYLNSFIDSDDDKLHTMCKYVARKYNVADEYMVALNWATELCLETV